MKNRWGSYDDYAQEIDEEAELKAHEAGECNEATCMFCISERDDATLADDHGYYDSKGHRVK